MYGTKVVKPVNEKDLARAVICGNLLTDGNGESSKSAVDKKENYAGGIEMRPTENGTRAVGPGHGGCEMRRPAGTSPREEEGPHHEAPQGACGSGHRSGFGALACSRSHVWSSGDQPSRLVGFQRPASEGFRVEP